MRGASLAGGNQQRDGNVDGLLVEGRPVKGVVVLEDDDGCLLDGGVLCVRHGKAVGHARLAHVLAGDKGLVDGIGVIGDAKLDCLLGDEAQHLVAALGVLVNKDVVGSYEIAHWVLLWT